MGIFCIELESIRMYKTLDMATTSKQKHPDQIQLQCGAFTLINQFIQSGNRKEILKSLVERDAAPHITKNPLLQKS